MENNIIRKFDSVSAFNAYLENHEATTKYINHQESRSERASDIKFTGTNSFGEANDKLLYGDSAIFSEMKMKGLNVDFKGTTAKKIPTSAVVGAIANVPNYIAGVPTSMITRKQIDTKTKVINVVFNAIYPFFSSNDDIIKASVITLNYLIELEKKGLRINLYLSMFTNTTGSNKNKQTTGCLLKLKDSAQKIDLLKIAYPFCNPSMLRRHFFAYIEKTKGVNYCGDYGLCIIDNERIKTYMQQLHIEGAIISGYELIKRRFDEAYIKESLKQK